MTDQAIKHNDLSIKMPELQHNEELQFHKTCDKRGHCENKPSTEIFTDINKLTICMVIINMAQEVMKKIMYAISSRPPESGGIILGPVGSNDVTDFHFDSGGTCTGASYSPDYLTLSKLMKEKWIPSGIDMKGFVHSHPGKLDWLTNGDMAYINRLLDRNPDMDMFIAPIVIPDQFRIRPIVVLRKQPRTPQEARIELF